MTRSISLPTIASMSGTTVDRAWPSLGRPGSDCVADTNWPPGEGATVVAAETSTPNS